MQRSRELLVGSLVAALTVAGGAAALAPDRTIVTPLPVQKLALTGRSVAFVADTPKRLQCARIGLWNSATSRRFVFESKEQCLEEGSTGQGVWDVAIATRRLLWLTFAGGNFRGWSLWTATTTRPKPRQLRFVARDVDDAPPIVLGPGTAEGMPYAVDRRIVYLGDNGKAIFKTTVASPVRALASDSHGRFGVTVAALLSSGEIVGLDRSGNEVLRMEFPPGAVRAVGLDSPTGIAVQVRRRISFPGGGVTLPPEATMVDFGQGRVLWTRAGDIGATTVTGHTTRLVDATPDTPTYGQIVPQGVAWSVGRTVHWRGGALR